MTLNDTQPTYQLTDVPVQYFIHWGRLISNIITLPDIVFTDKAINQHCIRVRGLNYSSRVYPWNKNWNYVIVKSGCVNKLWVLLATWWPYSLIHVRLTETPPAVHADNTHSLQPSAVSVNHSLTAPPFYFSLYVFHPFFSSFFFFFTVQGMLTLQGGWWFTGATQLPMSHTHPMCLLLATLRETEGWTDREKEGESEKGGRGENEEFDMLCAWVTCIKQRWQIVWMYVCVCLGGIHENIPESSKKSL